MGVNPYEDDPKDVYTPFKADKERFRRSMTHMPTVLEVEGKENDLAGVRTKSREMARRQTMFQKPPGVDGMSTEAYRTH